MAPNFTKKQLEQLAALRELAVADEPGLDGIRPSSCFANGVDMANAKHANAAWNVWSDWVDFYALETAILAELV